MKRPFSKAVCLTLSFALVLAGCQNEALEGGSTSYSSAGTSQQVVGIEDKFNQWVKTLHLLNYLNKRHDQEQDHRLATKQPGVDVTPMTESVVYEEIIRLKAPYQHLEEEITDHLKQLTQQSKSGTEAQKQTAQQKSQEFFRVVKNLWDSQAIAKYPLYDIIQEWDETVPGFIDELPHEAKTIARDIKSNSREVLEQEKERIKEELYQISEDYVKSLPAGEKPRLPNSTQKQIHPRSRTQVQTAAQHCIHPSTGSSGNVTGSEFLSGTWVLSYDDGPHPTRSGALMDMLAANGVVANFFWLSQLAPNRLSVVHRALNEGHLVANHSHSHAALHAGANLDVEVIGSNRIFTQITSYQVRSTMITMLAPFFRCPGGGCIDFPGTSGSRRTRQILADLGIVHAKWSVDPRDWERISSADVINRVSRGMQGASRGIVLLHDIHQRSVDASATLIPQLFRNRRTQRLDDAVAATNQAQGCPRF